MACWLTLVASLLFAGSLQGCSPDSAEASDPSDKPGHNGTDKPSGNHSGTGNHSGNGSGSGSGKGHGSGSGSGKPVPGGSGVPALPVMPTEYALKVHYTITTNGTTAHYLTSRIYNLNGTSSPGQFQYREDDLINGELAASTIELPTSKNAAYRYNAYNKECITWQFVATIDGFPLLYRAAPYAMEWLKNETLDATDANVFQFVFDHWWDQLTQKFVERTYTVWFKKDTNMPLQVFDSMSNIDGHVYTVTDFTTNVVEASFEVPAEWNCKDPAQSAVVV